MASWGDEVLERLRSPVLDAVRELTGVWVVGGAVRDALLGREPRELDLLVEGDARPVAGALGDPAAVHERFGTFTVGATDVVAARRETYPAPGALPEVELGATIDEDLARRDFTINAMAVRVADGREAAWPGALDDLRDGALRVLHERSFADDPTRLVRMARYAARLGFAPEPQTGEQARAAIDGSALATVSGTRLGAELRRLLRDEPLPDALIVLDREGIARQLVHPGFAADRGLLSAVLEATPPGAAPGLAALGACLLDADDVSGALDRLAFAAGERAIVAAAADGRALAEALRQVTTPAEVAVVSARRPAEALAVAAALGAGEPVRRWFDEWRHVRAEVTGEDLLSAGLQGPAVGAGLRAAWAAAAGGATREAQLEAALGEAAA